MLKSNENSFPQGLRFSFKWMWCVIILLALFVRFWKIEYIPYANDADELAHVWAGQSLIEFGMPISWSSFDHTDTQWHWTQIPSTVVEDSKVSSAKFVRPWFDHSFVLPLIIGGWSEMLGYHFPDIPPALYYRLPFLLIAGINLVLIYQIAKKTFGQWPATFALAIISFSPTFILAQRMVVAENLMSTFILLAIYLFLTEQPIWSVTLATGLAGLVKIPSLCLVPVIGLPLLIDKKYKQVLTYGIGVALIVGVGYCAYGAAIDWHAFTSAMKDQSSRLLGWSNPAFIFSQPGFHTKAMLDLSYYLILLLGLTIFIVPMNRNTKVLAGATLASLLTIWVTSAEQDMLGWYKIPLFCLLAIDSAAVFKWFLDEHDQSEKLQGGAGLLAALFIWIVVLNNFGLVRFPTAPLPEAQLLRLLVGGVLLGGLLLMNLKVPKNVYVWICIAGIVCYAVQSLYFADKLFAASCKDRNCPTPLVTFNQTVKQLLKR